MRCPVLVSRTDEMARLRDALALPGSGHGGVWVLRGEPGVGKSRLAATVLAEAEEAGMAVLAGRAVRSAAPMPMRPLGEALLAWLRTGSVPEDRRLAPYLPALGRLAPQLGTAPDDGGSSVMLVGEGMLRLASALDGPGALLLVEDLHWADPETLGVLEYVADNVRDVPLVVVATTRPYDAPVVTELVGALQSRGAATPIELAPLDEDEVAPTCWARAWAVLFLTGWRNGCSGSPPASRCSSRRCSPTCSRPGASCRRVPPGGSRRSRQRPCRRPSRARSRPGSTPCRPLLARWWRRRRCSAPTSTGRWSVRRSASTTAPPVRRSGSCAASGSWCPTATGSRPATR
ncbi:ATP-binding protein [Nocardioides immobilis]|uniref:ATP-binding protein n=1 Tax=Nocardioides immobilis TaxID=2049295 RepID=A0A417Y5L8_9ACTN|nr:ATP-binding protein [Nocardioides immobilis]